MSSEGKLIQSSRGRKAASNHVPEFFCFRVKSLRKAVNRKRNFPRAIVQLSHGRRKHVIRSRVSAACKRMRCRRCAHCELLGVAVKFLPYALRDSVCFSGRLVPALFSKSKAKQHQKR